MTDNPYNRADSSGRPRFGEMMNNPEKFFAQPYDVVKSADLSREQKIALLTQWQNDLILRHEAETEGMDRQEQARKQLLPAITDALIRLGVKTTVSRNPR
jgi:hypothetical protein